MHSNLSGDLVKLEEKQKTGKGLQGLID